MAPERSARHPPLASSAVSSGPSGDANTNGRPLSDGWPSVGGAVLLDGTVHRSTGPWTAAVHALLGYLESRRFDGAPRVLGFDARGREVLSWVDGVAPGYPFPAWMQTEEVLVDLGALLRRYHDTVVDFTPPPGAQWRRWLGSPGGPLVRHGDLWPCNVVFRAGRPVALIDWEFAQPGDALDDVASAAKQWVPLCSDDRAAGDGWALPLDRRKRLRALCDGYGLGEEGRASLIARVLRNAEYGFSSHKAWGEAGVPGFREMWEAGSGASILGDRAWLADEREHLEGF